ncbi:flagellar export chaperone FliS [Brevibacillus laterosporus]|uniref:Flagellar secretion chaperone FliS n=1 Tax=Brevibacillus laterosporus LMG 15441 TaxID=1042163 RepID=A0A075RBM6_BRELA|nr:MULTISPECIES: flagellar export chaperone FliS [Brevibacillus]AIG28633.1 flagellar protein FliS [Brevibacillus laterosporus LMG 15441]ERM17116.1 flagellar biosynthesis protein FliS [Brevibacillus laterosporus PE36]MCR8963019.1 flagellar export chaperone FliS [Brevibacillus laterosporus]MCZ0835175.1 flagellar export chaperone FliS [Brevibacillus halotolerans]RJL12042.1 flagellar export chaperone FliS [Brevibacillus laterosporus]
MNQTAAQIYQQNQVKTASPGELTLMLYNGGIRFSKEAKIALEKQDVQKAHQSIIKVQDIIRELMVTLDQNVAISEQFMLMYDYMYNRTIEANLKKDGAIITEVEEFFVQFRDTWKQAILIARRQPEGNQI